MSIAVDFYTFQKKVNSTKVPSSGAVTFNCNLKEPTSALNPTILLAARDLPTPAAAPTIYNYANITAFQRKYFITDWVYNAGIWEISMKVDPLGSWKTGIGTIQCYVERAASASDGTIMDTLYPATTDYKITHINTACAWYNVAPSGGCYIIGCINYQSSNSIGAVAYYACTQAQLNSLLNFLFGTSIYTNSNISEISQGLYASFFNPFQYIVSCIWFPFASATFGSVTTDIKVGYWSTGINATIVSNVAHKTYVTATLPDHYQVARGSYLNYAPYTEITLYIPPFGCIPLDTSYRRIGNYLYSPVYIDHLTGEATIKVNITASSSSLTEDKPMCERTATIGVPIQLAQVMYEYSASSATSFLTQLVTQGITSILGSASGIGNTAGQGAPTVSTSGANGSFINFIMPPGITVKHSTVVADDPTDNGKPLMQIKTINTLSGYIKCMDVPVSLPITAEEADMIKSYMENGFYYE